MALLALVFLRVVHSFYSLITLLSASWRRLQWSPPLPLQVTRRRMPRHLALLLVPDSVHDPAATRESLLETVSLTVGWCRTVGIEKLTLYDSEGVLVDCADQISQRASVASEPNGYESSGSDIEYPLTPPSSDCSDSRPLSPEDRFQKEASVITVRLPEVIRKKSSRYGLKRRHSDRQKSDVYKPPLALCIASRQSSKPAVAAAATFLARRRAHTTDEEQPELTVESLNTIIEGPHCVSAPDFLIVHHLRRSDQTLPLELHGFPPWQVRLTEIHHSCKQRPLRERLSFRRETFEDAPQLLTELDFRAALDEYAGAEMRFGK
ncbi:hypothetical protein B0H19DRAFT_1127005 [Mycena capillaripes]|nr:hypothetical protein B0H19DRAFT_1127005 [Mycena capillaripes]